MKSSNSRDKYSRTQVPVNDNRLMKTANQAKEPMEKTAYNRPTSGKNLPPRNPQPVQKKQYNIEENMTVSRINEAKQGLQLLKKKMSAKGMSREKPKTTQSKVQKPLLRASSQKIEDEEDPYNRAKMPPKAMAKKYSEPEQTTYSKPSETKIPRKPEPKKPQYNPVYEQQANRQMQIPIKPKKDFASLLEEELRKENQIGGMMPQSKPSYQPSNAFPNQDQDVGQLIQCSQGCGRMFNSQAISKHQKICQKVFQSKRKAFDSSAHRAPEVEGFNKPPQVASKKAPPKQAAKQPEKEGKMPKWKAQSLAFRAGLKQGKGEQLTKEQKQAMSGPEDDFIQCKFCGRKFNPTAGARHIAFCQTKSKQVPRKKK